MPGPAEAVLQLPPQVDASFLRRFAGDISDLARERATSVGSSGGESVKRHSARSSNVAERSKQQHEFGTLVTSGRSAVVHDHAPVRRVGQAELTRRVQRVARRVEAAFQRRSLLAHDLSTRAIAAGTVLPIDLQSLADHWSMPIDGPTASGDVLTRLADAASWYERGSQPDVEPGLSNSANEEHDSSPKRRTETFSESRNSGHPLLSESPLPETSDVERWTGLVPAGAEAVSLLTPAATPAIAPPSLTPSLPPLHSQKQDDVVMPIAAATAQRRARVEEDIAHGEDLTLLARRMEQILKQEARRHGIDV